MADESPAGYELELSGNESEDSPEEERDGETSEPADEEILPYPFIGRPYVTNSILNTLDLTLISKAVKEIRLAQFESIQLTVADKFKEKYSLSQVLFGSRAVAFSNIAAKLVVASDKSFPLVALLGLPVANSQKKDALKCINGFFSGTVSDSGVDLQESIANKESVADVPTIIKALSSLTCPPWVIHQECWLEKADGSCDVPHGKLDVVIGRPTGDLRTLPGAGVAVALIDKAKKPFTPIAPVSGKVQVQLEKPKSERQVLLELLAFTEVIREDGPVVMIKASRYTFRPYIYIRGMDLLFKGPLFNYNSTTPRKISDSVKGLVVLCSILNDDVKEYLMLMYDRHKESYSSCKKCGWAKAMRDSNAAYKQEVLIEKPGLSSTHSLSPTPVEASDVTAKILESFQEVQMKRAKLSFD